MEQYHGKLFRVTSQAVEIPGGIQKVFERAERPPGVRVLAANSSHILLTKEWRDETGSWDHRLPGGKVFDSLEEYLVARSNSHCDLERCAQIAARREFEEETSIRRLAEEFKLLHHSICGATVIWDLYYYVIKLRDLDKLPASITSREGERIQPGFFSLAEALELCLNAEIQEDRTVAVLLRYLLQVKR